MKEYNNKRKEKDHEGKYIRDVQNKNREFNDRGKFNNIKCNN